MGDSYFRQESGHNPSQSSLYTSPSSHGSMEPDREGSSLVSSASECSIEYDGKNMHYWRRENGRPYVCDESERKDHIHKNQECIKKRRRKSSGSGATAAVKEEDTSMMTESSGYASGSRKGSLSVEMKEKFGEELYERTFTQNPRYETLCRGLMKVAEKWFNKQSGKSGFKIICCDNQQEFTKMNQAYLDCFINIQELKVEVVYF